MIVLRRGLPVALLFCLAVLHFAERTNFATADLGRHLKNGELFATEGRILAVNGYSYTHPDYPAICHHWLSGYVFYRLWQLGDFFGLSLIYTGLLLATFAIFFIAALRLSSVSWALLGAVLLLPLAACRTAIRPEGLSMLFLAVDFFLLAEFRQNRLRRPWLWIVPALHVVWVNCHIFFFLGLVLVGIFALDALVTEGWERKSRALTATGLAAVVASLLNPFGIRGLAEPFRIFESYGYAIAENQPVWFMIRRFPQNPLFPYFLALLVVALVLVIARFLRERNWRAVFLSGALLGVFGLLAVTTVRAMAIWALIALPLTAETLAGLLRGMDRKSQSLLEGVTEGIVVVLICVGLIFPQSFFSPVGNFTSFLPTADQTGRGNYFQVLIRPGLWAGLLPDSDASARFWHATSLHGPIFNQVDMVISKHFGGARNIEFRAEVFNLFNSANFSNPNATLPNALPTTATSEANKVQPGQPFSAGAAGSAFGVLTSTVGRTVGLGTARQIQFAFRLNF